MTIPLLIAVLVLLVTVLVLLIILLVRKPSEPDLKQVTDSNRKELTEQLTSLRRELNDTLHHEEADILSGMDRQIGRLTSSTGDQIRLLTDSMNQLTTLLNQSLHSLQESLTKSMEQSRQADADRDLQLQNSVAEQMRTITERMDALERSNEAKLDSIRKTLADSMTDMRQENTKKLDEIRITVDEKLQDTLNKRIGDSFRTVSEQLKLVSESIGEMKTLANDVGGLKKVLSNVKTRGILGETQLGAILAEILSPEQYETNVVTIPGKQERVEFAVRLPGQDGENIYLPIDSKFPGERYQQLLEAQESGDKAAVDAAYKALETVILSEAKDISTKYVCVPHTTSFGIMFLPFEGLYAEVVNRGLVEKLQQQYKVNVAGPSTMAALLNSLQMGFRTLAIQKRSNEVWQILGSVKSEFDKFGGVLEKMQSHLTLTAQDLDDLMGRRTRAIQRKLTNVQTLEEPADLPLLPEED